MPVDYSQLCFNNITRNTLDCDQSTPRTLFSPTYLLNLVKPELAPFDPPTPKTHPRTKHGVNRMIRRGDMAI